MELPILTENYQERDMLQEFRGYNHNIRIMDNEFYNEKNMSDISYPVLSPRDPRGITKYISNNSDIKGFVYKDTLYYVKVEDNGHGSNNLVLYKFNAVGDYSFATLKTGVTDTTTKRQLVSMGAYIVIWPDKVVVNTLDIENPQNFTTTVSLANKLFVETCDANGNAVSPEIIPDIANYDVTVKRNNNDYICWYVETGGVKKYYYAKWDGTQYSAPENNYASIWSDANNASIKSNVDITLKGFTGDFALLNGEKTVVKTAANSEIERNQIVVEVSAENGATYPVGYFPKFSFMEFYKVSVTTLKSDTVSIIASKSDVDPTTLKSAISITYNGTSYRDVYWNVNGFNRLYKWDVSGIFGINSKYVAVTENTKAKVQIYADRSDLPLNVGDTITISGYDNGLNGTYTITKSKIYTGTSGSYTSYLYDIYIDLNGPYYVTKSYAAKNSYGSPVAEFVGESSMELAQQNNIPDVRFLVEHNNRLWGAIRGEVNGTIVNEICSCKLGNPKSWKDYIGDGGAYAVSVGSDGDFTGSAVYGGNVLFFKENCIHKIYGTIPANFQLVTTMCRGVQKGCEDSVKVVNELLYYKSRDGVMVYDGTIPRSISEELGDVFYSDAHAGVENGKYYISMKDKEGNHHLFCYNSKYGIWHREDDARAISFVNDDGSLMYYDGLNLIRMRANDDDVGTDAPVEWECETGILGFNSPDNKYVSRLNLRLQLDLNSVCNLFIEYDSSGVWESKGSMKGGNLRTFTLPIIPKRCDHFRIKLSGTGKCKLFSIAKIVENGSDVG